MPVHFHHGSPILRVARLEASIAYYTGALGFTLDWVHENIFASVSRMSCNLMLSQGDQGMGNAWVYVGVDNVDTLYHEIKERGGRIRQDPTNFPWAYEIQIEDLDRNVLRFGSEPLSDMPYGPWMDMFGRLWLDQGQKEMAMSLSYKALYISPMIPSYHLEETGAFFTRLLGFRPIMDTPEYAIYGRNDRTVHLLRAGEDIGQMELYMEVDQIDVIWEHLRDKTGELKVKPPFDREYGMRELHIEIPQTKALLFIGQVI